MDRRGKKLVDMVKNKYKKEGKCESLSSDEVSGSDTKMMVKKETVSTSNCLKRRSPSPCPFIEGDPALIEDLLEEFAKSGDESDSGNQIQSHADLHRDGDLSCPSSVLSQVFDQPLENIPSHISSFPPSVADVGMASDAPASMDSGNDFLLAVGSAQSNDRDFSPETDVDDPDYVPCSDETVKDIPLSKYKTDTTFLGYLDETTGRFISTSLHTELHKNGELNCPSSILSPVVNQPLQNIVSNIPSYPPSVADDGMASGAPASVSSLGDFLLVVGSVESYGRDFSPESNVDNPDYVPCVDEYESDEDMPLSNYRTNVTLISFLDETTGLFIPSSTNTAGNFAMESLLNFPFNNENDVSDNNQDNEILRGRPKKGRKRKHEECNRHINKINRNSNKSYYDYKDNLKEPKIFTNKPCICSKKCHESSIEIKEMEFKRFWGLGSYDAQNAYIAAKVKQTDIKNKTAASAPTLQNPSNANIKPKKMFSREYEIAGHHVCKNHFLSIYQISSCRVNTALKKFKSTNSFVCQRGFAQGGANKITESQRNDVINFIKRIPKYKSHYKREVTDAEFIPPGVTLANLVMIYKLTHEQTAVSASTFRYIFYTCFHLKTARLKKDTCNTCDKYHAAIKNESNEEKKGQLKDVHSKHLEQAEHAQKLMKRDIKRSKDIENIEVITFDMEKTLPLPRIPTNVVFYKRQLWLYNEGVYAGKSDKGFCYVWVEGEAGKGAQEIGSVLLKHLKEELPNNVKKLILWSDSCGGQNRNIKITLLLKAIIEQHPILEEVTLNFLVSGHSFLPNDRHFANIESALKQHQRVYIPDDYIHIMKNARKTKPLTVKKMSGDEFYSTAEIEKHITNRKVGTNKEKVSWLNARQISIRKDNKYIINIKETFSPEDNGVNVNIKKSKLADENFFDMLTPLWPNGKPISNEKLSDLGSLMELVPKDCQPFYLNLHSELGIIEDVDGFNVRELDFEVED